MTATNELSNTSARIQAGETQPDFAPLHGAAAEELLSEIQFTVTPADVKLADSEQPDFSPLLLVLEKGK